MQRLKIISLLVVVLLLTGCFSPKLSLSLQPSEIKIKQGDTEITDLVLSIRTSGFSSKYSLDKITMVLFDENNEEVHTFNEVKLGEKIPVVPFLKHKEELDPISLDFFGQDLLAEYYPEALQGKTYLLLITLHGTKDSILEVDVIFE